MPIHTIPASDLRLLLAAAKLRRHTRGRTCQLCVLTGAIPMWLDCHNRPPSASALQHGRRLARTAPLVSPLPRGHIGHVIDRTNLRGGPGEVRRTWGTGVKALRAEPRHVLNGGQNGGEL